jgi:hypothetical protein
MTTLPPPARATPGQPTSLRATLQPRGALSLRWQPASPSDIPGAIYNIRRRLPGEGNFTFVGTTGTCSYTDHFLPAGTTGVQYLVYSQVGLTAGPFSSPFTVVFGTEGGARGGPLVITEQFEGEAGRGQLAA